MQSNTNPGGFTGRDLSTVIIGGVSSIGAAAYNADATKRQNAMYEQSALASNTQLALAKRSLELEAAQTLPDQELLRKMATHAFDLSKTAPTEALEATRQGYKDLIFEQLATIDRATEGQLRQIDQDAGRARQEISDAVPKHDGRYARLLADVSIATQDMKQKTVAAAQQKKVETENAARNQYIQNAVNYRQNISSKQAELLGVAGSLTSATPKINYSGYVNAGGIGQPPSGAWSTAAQNRQNALQGQQAIGNLLGDWYDKRDAREVPEARVAPPVAGYDYDTQGPSFNVGKVIATPAPPIQGAAPITFGQAISPTEALAESRRKKNFISED